MNTKPGVEVQIPPVDAKRLEWNGYYKSIGLPSGQVADYRKALPDGRGIHVKVYRGRTTAHLDRKDPSVDFFGHLRQDAPVFTGLLVGAAFFLLASR